MDLTSKKTQRNSNIEFLRIISVIGIVLSHCVIHGGIYSSDNLFLKEYATFFYPLGKLFFVTFATISCYFMLKSKFNSEHFLKLYFTTIFYNILILIIDNTIFKQSFSVTDILYSIFPINGFWITQGYVAGFLLFMLVFPFINMILRKLNLSCKLYLFTLLFVVNQFLIFRNSINVIAETLFFIDLSILLSCLQNSNLEVSLKKKNYINLILFITSYLIMFIVWIFAYVKTSIKNNDLNRLVQALLYTEFSPIPIMGGVSIFYFCYNMKNRYNKVINFISPFSIDVLLIHDSGLIRDHIWQDIFKSNQYWNNKFPLWLFLTSVIICFSGLVSFLFRKYLMEKIFFSLNCIKSLKRNLDYVYNLIPC